MSVLRRRPVLIFLFTIFGLALVFSFVYGERAYVKILRIAILHELQPVYLADCRYERIGRANDGGYIMCANELQQATAAYSYGIAGEDSWGCDVATRTALDLFQFDCFDLREPQCASARGPSQFVGECLGAAQFAREGRPFDTLSAQLARWPGTVAGPVLVKMDIEGDEWQALAATPDETLAQIDQLVVEFHGISEDLFAKWRLLRRLNEQFHVINLHFNNHACDPGIQPFPAWAFQVTFVRRKPGQTAEPRFADTVQQLNMPDHSGRPDCQLP